MVVIGTRKNHKLEKGERERERYVDFGLLVLSKEFQIKIKSNRNRKGRVKH
jgi:hypothetical protein